MFVTNYERNINQRLMPVYLELTTTNLSSFALATELWPSSSFDKCKTRPLRRSKTKYIRFTSKPCNLSIVHRKLVRECLSLYKIKIISVGFNFRCWAIWWYSWILTTNFDDIFFSYYNDFYIWSIKPGWPVLIQFLNFNFFS